MCPLKAIIVKIKNLLEVALPLVVEGTMLVVENLRTQVMNPLLLLRMIPRGNVLFLFFLYFVP